MVYNRQYLKMKKTLFALILALPMLFAACGKDDNGATATSPKGIDFEKLNTWIGTSEASVVSELQQMGFTAEGGYDEKGSLRYSYIDQAGMVYLSCYLTTDTNNTVRVVSVMQMSVASSYSSTLSTLQNYVQQERQLFGNPSQSMGEIDWDDTDDEDSAIDGSEEYDNYDVFSAAAATMGSHLYVQLAWSDFYQDRVASVAASFDNMNSGAYGATQMVGISLFDKSFM